MGEILIVDGYNVIGAAEERQGAAWTDLADARDWLIGRLADYQGFTGVKVYVVFDAHLVPGLSQVIRQRQVEVIYTKEKETADEAIEKLVRRLREGHRQIYVATSDQMEQRVIFGEGALRKSARELLLELDQAEREIRQEVEHQYSDIKGSLPLSDKLAEIFEKWRRGG